MQATGVNRISRPLAAAGLLLILVTNAAGADPLDADIANTALGQPLFADVAVTEVDAVNSSSVSASQNSASAGDSPVGRVEDEGAFLGKLITQYFESYN